MLNRRLYCMFLRRNARLVGIVALCSGLLFYLLALLFPAADPHEAQLISSTWPDIMKDLFGDPALAFADIYAWLNLQVFHITSWAIYGVCASILAARIVARETEEKTLEVLLSYPVSRTGVLVSVTAGTLTLMCVGVIVGIVGCSLGVVSCGWELHLLPLSLAGAECLLVAMVCAAIALVVSVCGGGQTLSVSISLALFSVMFLFSEMLSKLVPLLGKLRFVSPFHYYRAEDILVHGSYDCSALFFLAVYSIVPLVLAVVIFSRRDIPS